MSHGCGLAVEQCGIECAVACIRVEASRRALLGLGVQPQMTSLGNMVGYGRIPDPGAPWIMAPPTPSW